MLELPAFDEGHCPTSAAFRVVGPTARLRLRRSLARKSAAAGGVLYRARWGPKVVLADRMGCLKGGVVADVVVPTPDYVRFATHYRFRPDFCHARDPESKGIVENLVGYSKRDLMIPLGVIAGEVIDLLPTRALPEDDARRRHAQHMHVGQVLRHAACSICDCRCRTDGVQG